MIQWSLQVVSTVCFSLRSDRFTLPSWIACACIAVRRTQPQDCFPRFGCIDVSNEKGFASSSFHHRSSSRTRSGSCSVCGADWSGGKSAASSAHTDGEQRKFRSFSSAVGARQKTRKGERGSPSILSSNENHGESRKRWTYKLKTVAPGTHRSLRRQRLHLV